MQCRSHEGGTDLGGVVPQRAVPAVPEHAAGLQSPERRCKSSGKDSVRGQPLQWATAPPRGQCAPLWLEPPPHVPTESIQAKTLVGGG